MIVQNQPMALSPRQPLSGQRVRRISGLDRRAHDSRDGKNLKVCTVNVGTMKGRSHEVALMLGRRKADICCIQEVRYKSNSSTTIGSGEDKYKFWYSSSDSGLNGVGIMLRQDLVENVVEVERFCDRMMRVKLVIGRTVYHVLSVYAPQVGRPNAEKEDFRNKLEDIITSIDEVDGIIIAGDLNCHIGSSNVGYENIMGAYGYGNQNDDGVALLDICNNHNLRIANSYFCKDDEKLITYKSGNISTQLDLILWRSRRDVNLINCKAIPGEECLTQHRLVRADFKIKNFQRKKWKGMKKLKVWKLKDENTRQQFLEEVSVGALSFNGTWNSAKTIMLRACEKTCGRTTGRRGEKRETWWWNDEVERVIKEKQMAYKTWQRSSLEADKRRYQACNNRVKKEVAKAKVAASRTWSEDLDTEEGRQKMFKVAKQMRRDQKDVIGANYIRDSEGNIKVESADVVERWKGYFENLLNVENPNNLEEVPPVQGPLEEISQDEVKMALRLAKNGKAAGPSEVTTEMFAAAGDLGLNMLVSVYRGIMKEDKAPNDWHESITIPLFKGKGDALSCEKYRGLRLLEHGMKVWERVLIKRLEAHTKVHPQQFGFAQGKSTTDAIHIARQLQEKFMQKKKKLFHIFVDLEKAFDKVPRQAIEWALRRQLVPEWLVRAVMGLYHHSSSQVRFAGAMSGSFPIGVGVHQGSALSPLLFKLVLEESTKHCRRGDPWELLYADDLVLTADTKEGVEEMFNEWRSAMELRGLKINVAKTKLLISGKENVPAAPTGQYPCGICGRGVGVNSILCTACNRWCHHRCTGLASFSGVTNYICLVCNGARQNIPAVDESIVTDAGTIEEVTEFTYLGDVISCGGGAETSVRHRIAIAWHKWREISSLLSNRGIPLKHRSRVYNACIRSVMLYGAVTWALTQREESLLQSCDRRMLRRLCGVTLRDRISSDEVLRRCGLESILLRVRKMRMAWFGHVYRRDGNDPVRRVKEVEAPGRRPRGRPKKTWSDCVRGDLSAAGVPETAADDRARWKTIISSLTAS